MVAETRKQIVYVPEFKSRRETEQVNASHKEGARARVVENARPPFLVEYARLAVRIWFAGWPSSRLY